MKKQSFWKHPQYGHVYGISIPSNVGYLAWPSLVKPKAPPPPKDGQAPGQPRYEATVLLDKESAQTKDFVADLTKMATGMLAVYNEGKQVTISLGANVLKDGDEMDLEAYPFMKGKWVLQARNAKDEFEVLGSQIGTDGNFIPCPKEFFQGGMQVRLVVTPLITAHGVSFKLNSIQFKADDGTRFGGGTRDYQGLLKEADGIVHKEAARESPKEVAFDRAQQIATPAVEVAVVPAIQQTAAVQTAAQLRASIAAETQAKAKAAAAPKKGMGLALDVLG